MGAKENIKKWREAASILREFQKDPRVQDNECLKEG